MDQFNIQVNSDLCNLMKCKNCKYFQNGCSKNPKQEDTCIEWEQGTPSLETAQDRETKEVLIMMYHEIEKVLREYLVLEDFQYKIIALWILGTYAHEGFNTYPLLFFNAMRGSGKTRALKLISSLGAGGDGSVQNNLTEAVLFRIPRGKTTCIDEVEQIGSKEKSTLRELLNAAYKKGMKVCRMKKTKKKNPETGQLEEVQVAEEFEPYFPIALANINGLDDVLSDRAITLILEKSGDPVKTKKAEDFDTNLKIRWIKHTLCSFSVVVQLCSSKNIYKKWNKWLTFNAIYTNCTNNIHIINNTNYTTTHPKLIKYLEMVSEDDGLEIDADLESFFKKLNEADIVGRNFELFMPLLIMAKFIDNSVFDEIFNIVKSMVHERKSNEFAESKDVSLFEFVYNKENIIGKDYVSIKDITREFRMFINADPDEEKWVNDRWMGKALKRLNLILEKRRVSHGVEVTFNYAKAKEKLKIFKI